MLKPAGFQKAYNEWFSGISKWQDSTQKMGIKDYAHLFKAFAFFPVTIGFAFANRVFDVLPEGQNKENGLVIPQPMAGPVYRGF